MTSVREAALRLDQLPPRRPARILSVDWDTLAGNAARRLRELGFDEGVEIEMTASAPFGGDPIACRVGRMTVALRRAQAHAVTVEPIAG